MHAIIMVEHWKLSAEGIGCLLLGAACLQGRRQAFHAPTHSTTPRFDPIDVQLDRFLDWEGHASFPCSPASDTSIHPPPPRGNAPRPYHPDITLLQDRQSSIDEQQRFGDHGLSVDG